MADLALPGLAVGALGANVLPKQSGCVAPRNAARAPRLSMIPVEELMAQFAHQAVAGELTPFRATINTLLVRPRFPGQGGWVDPREFLKACCALGTLLVRFDSRCNGWSSESARTVLPFSATRETGRLREGRCRWHVDVLLHLGQVQRQKAFPAAGRRVSIRLQGWLRGLVEPI